MRYKYKNVVFDDLSLKINDGLNNWSQICDKCVKKHRIPSRLLDEWSGHGICGVEGCNNDSDHYIDFEDVDLKEIP